MRRGLIRTRASGGARSRVLVRRLVPFGLVAAAAAVTAYLFDPDRGRTRRARLSSRVPASFRRAGRRVRRVERRLKADVYGAQQKMLHPEEQEKEYDDATLARKVESELFADREIPKGRMNVSSEMGVVVLVGEVDTAEQVRDIEKRVRRVKGVADVKNLLHLPKTSAPGRTAQSGSSTTQG